MDDQPFRPLPPPACISSSGLEAPVESHLWTEASTTASLSPSSHSSDAEDSTAPGSTAGRSAVEYAADTEDGFEVSGTTTPASQHDQMEIDHDAETVAIDILTTILPDKSKLTKALPTDNLLNCLANLAASKAPLLSTSRPSAFRSLRPIYKRKDEDEEDSDLIFRVGLSRPRAASNPEGCDVWQQFEHPSVSGTGASLAARAQSGLPPISTQLSKVGEDNRVGIYTRQEREALIARWIAKRQRRIWTKKIRYSCRKKLADKRVRIKGRFVKLPASGEDEHEEEEEGKELIVGYKRPIDSMLAASWQREHQVVDTGEDEEDFTLPTRRARRHSIA